MPIVRKRWAPHSTRSPSGPRFKTSPLLRTCRRTSKFVIATQESTGTHLTETPQRRARAASRARERLCLVLVHGYRDFLVRVFVQSRQVSGTRPQDSCGRIPTEVTYRPGSIAGPSLGNDDAGRWSWPCSLAGQASALPHAVADVRLNATRRKMRIHRVVHGRVYSPRRSYLDWYLKTHIATAIRITAAIRTYRLVICYKSPEHSRADKLRCCCNRAPKGHGSQNANFLKAVSDGLDSFSGHGLRNPRLPLSHPKIYR